MPHISNDFKAPSGVCVMINPDRAYLYRNTLKGILRYYLKTQSLYHSDIRLNSEALTHISRSFPVVGSSRIVSVIGSRCSPLTKTKQNTPSARGPGRWIKEVNKRKGLLQGPDRGSGWSDRLGTHPDDGIAIFWIGYDHWLPNRRYGILHYRLRTDEVKAKSLCNRGEEVQGEILNWANEADRIKLRTSEVCQRCRALAMRVNNRVQAQVRTKKFLDSLNIEK